MVNERLKSPGALRMPVAPPRVTGQTLGQRAVGDESMKDIHWDAAAKAHERDDGGSDMYYDFKTLKSGTLAELVGWVMALPADQPERVVIDAMGVGTINVHDIGVLAEREDSPGK